MRRSIDLGGAWELAGFDGYGEYIDSVALPEALPNFLWLPAEVPGSVYSDLTRAGWIDDVLAGCNTLKARWVEEQFWFYRRRFERPQMDAGQRCLLVLEQLDLDAHVYLNGKLIGEHHNFFRPLRLDITERLADENELIVRLHCGLLGAADKRGGDYNMEVTATQTKRALLRKPQFTARWDWSPRLINVGIGEGVRLEVCDGARLDAVVVTCELSDDHRRAALRVRGVVENLGARPQGLTLRCRIEELGVAAEVRADVPVAGGELTATLELEDPELWWPVGWGAQRLYDVSVELVDEAGAVLDGQLRRTGIRSVALTQEPAPSGGRYFHLVVNGRPLFCKGGNWVPPRLVYTDASREVFEELVERAVECGSNLLRIWGGGLYADPALLEACDQAGVLIWHDLMFACSKYPGDDPAFVEEVTREVAYQVRRMAHHPSVALWCGNNENELGTHDGWIRTYDDGTRPCEPMFHDTLAGLVAGEDPSRPYWPTSPWSPDGSAPTNMAIGDQHPWLVALGPPKGDYWIYRIDSSRFPNEGGMLGPSPMKTQQEILPEAERRVGSRTWLHHDNTQNTWRGEPLVDNLLRVNLCPRPRELTFEQYVHWGGVLHGEALEAGIDNWRRRKFESAAAVFWMFNDTWPATVSWTPVDYYLRRKPAFWYVKRAFAGVRAICVEEGGEVAVYLVNDTLEPAAVQLRYGLFGLGGGRPLDEASEVTCPANGAVVAARFKLKGWNELGVNSHGAFAIASQAHRVVSVQRLFRVRFKELAWAPANVHAEQAGERLRVVSDTFAWAVSLDADGERPVADNYFDLIPGVAYELDWRPGELPTPHAANPAAGVVGR